MEDLSTKHCVPCETGIPPFTQEKYSPLLKNINGWKVVKGKMLEKEFKKKDFKEILDFVNRIGEIAEEENHHPNLFLHDWNQLKVTLYTFNIGGLSENDFILAAKIDDLS